MKASLVRCVVAEFAGTLFLLTAVVGSGIMGERLAAGNIAIALLANTIATGAALVALILAFGPISGAQLNPAATLVDAWQGGIEWREAPAYIAAQLAGAFAGCSNRSSHVRTHALHCVDARPLRTRSALQRVCCYLRAALRHLGMCQAQALRRSLRCRRIHYRRVLVHRIDVLRQPCRHPRTIRKQHIRRRQVCRRSRICCCSVGRGLRRNAALAMAHPVTEG